MAEQLELENQQPEPEFNRGDFVQFRYQDNRQIKTADGTVNTAIVRGGSVLYRVLINQQQYKRLPRLMWVREEAIIN